MKRGTTPAIVIEVTGDTLADSTIYVTIKQHFYRLTKSGSDVEHTVTSDGCVLVIHLTQEETLKLRPNQTAKLDIRWITKDGYAGASDMALFKVGDVLKEGVIEYVG